MKKRYAMILAAAILFFSVTGCQNTSGTATAEPTEESAAESEESVSTDSQSADNAAKEEKKAAKKKKKKKEKEKKEVSETDYYGIYKPVLDMAVSHAGEFASQYPDAIGNRYAMYDMDGDGAKELIIDFYWNEAARHMWIYTVRDGQPLGLTEEDGTGADAVYGYSGGLLFEDAGMGYYSVSKVRIEGDTLGYDSIFQHEYGAGEDYPDIRDVDGVERSAVADLEWTDISDASALGELQQNGSTESAEEQGEYWLYGEGAGAFEDSRIEYADGKFTLSGTWSKGSTRAEAEGGARTPVSLTVRVGDGCRDILEAADPEDGREGIFDPATINEYFGAFGIVLHVVDGAVTEIIEYAI